MLGSRRSGVLIPSPACRTTARGREMALILFYLCFLILLCVEYIAFRLFHNQPSVYIRLKIK